MSDGGARHFLILESPHEVVHKMAHQVGGRQAAPQFAGALQFLATQLKHPVDVVPIARQGVSAEPTLQAHELLVRSLVHDLNVLAGSEQQRSVHRCGVVLDILLVAEFQASRDGRGRRST